MSDQPLTLTDADFASDTPPGYLSFQDKEKYTPRMAMLLGGTFVLQMIVPFVIMMITMPMIMFQNLSKGMSQHTKMAAWQSALWYPTVEGSGGGSRTGCKLKALDYAGQPLDQPAIELDMQPEWLIADGDKLWAVSKNEVAEVLPDGSRPVVMHPSRYLVHAMKPFLYQGKLAVVDWVDKELIQVFVLMNGEWNPVAELTIPDFSQTDVDEALEATDEDAPADALLPEHLIENSQRVQEAAVQIQEILQQPVNKNVPISLGLVATSDVIQVIATADAMHVVLAQNSKLRYHRGLPLKSDGEDATRKLEWSTIDVLPSFWSLASVGDSPALVAQFASGEVALQLWREVDGHWQSVADSEIIGFGPRTEVSTFSTPDGARTFAVVESMGGLTQELLELKPDAIVAVTELSGMPFANPFSGPMLKLQGFLQIPAWTLIAIMIFGSTWLMEKHRDPRYFKGRVPVIYASILRRTIAVGIDSLLVWGPIYLGWYLWTQQTGLSYAKFFRVMDAGPAKIQQFFLDLLPGMFASAGWLLFWLFLQWILLAFFGCTIGKYLCGVRVARTNLERPGLLRALIRMLLDVIETTFGVIVPLALVAFLDNRQRAADMVAGTVVVKAGSLREARALLASMKTSA